MYPISMITVDSSLIYTKPTIDIGFDKNASTITPGTLKNIGF